MVWFGVWFGVLGLGLVFFQILFGGFTVSMSGLKIHKDAVKHKSQIQNSLAVTSWSFISVGLFLM